ncbi:MAG TPA: hypothetical protein DCO79_00690 [Spirochaeta sp.]|nr:hypothetical protein [Spirochaeta sp.]
MRTTLDLPEDLLLRAMKVSNARTKTEVIKTALENLIRQEKVSNLVKFHGTVDLKIDLDNLRER